MKVEEETEKLRKPLFERLPEDVFNALHETIGEASMCWTDVEHAGRFQADVAGKIAFELCHYVADLLDEAREELGDDSVKYVTGDGASLKRPMMLLSIVEKMKVTGRRE